MWPIWEVVPFVRGSIGYSSSPLKAAPRRLCMMVGERVVNLTSPDGVGFGGSEITPECAATGEGEKFDDISAETVDNLRLSESGARALQALINDFERGGRKPLRQSRVDRLLERRRLATSDMLSVILALEAQGIAIDDDLGQRPSEDHEQEARETQEQLDGFKGYIQRIRRAGLLTADEEIALGRAIAQAREVEECTPTDAVDSVAAEIIAKGRNARRRLIVQNVRLVLSNAKRYVGFSDLSLEDLVQEGTLGLMRAVEKFDHTLGYKFSTYATWWIVQSITRAIADRGHAIRLPAYRVEEVQRVQRARRMLRRKLGVLEPDPRSIAEELDLDVAHVHYLLGLERLVPISLHSPLGGQDGDAIALDVVAAPEPSPEEVAEAEELREHVLRAIQTLPDRERIIAMRRFGIPDGQEWTLEQLGQQFGLTRERIRQIEAKILRKLRNPAMGLRAYASDHMPDETDAKDSA